MELEKIIDQYQKTFGTLPKMPKMVSMSIIADLMQDAIVSKVPVTPEEVWKRVEESGEPVDLVK